MAYCLPKKYASAFMNALKDGRIVPEKLMDLSSAERHTLFEGVVGEEHALEVNALFESKMLLQDQKAGMERWANKLTVPENTRKEILKQINGLSKVLQPADERAFLADLAAKKLGVTVTADEAKEIYRLSQVAAKAKVAMQQDMQPATWTAYGRRVQDITDYIDSLKPTTRTPTERFLDVINIPKTIMSTLDFSALFVQGWGMISTKQAWQGAGQMFRYFANEENFRNLNGYIIGHPDYELARSGKLALTGLGDKLTTREEAIQSSLVENFSKFVSDKTGIFDLIGGISRAYVGYLNYVRFNRFTELLTAARMGGEDVQLGSQTLNDLASVVNNFTGRGALGAGDRYANFGPVLNTLFFAPRKIVATVQMFNPVTFLNPKLSPTARRAAMRQLSGSLVATGAVLGLAGAMGAKIDMDPRSTDFAKIQIGGTKLDMTGGNAIYIRLLARLISNQEITSSGKLVELGEGYKPMTRADLILQYTRGKLSPIAGTVANAFYGTDPIGRPFSVTQEMRDKLIPMTINSFIDFAENDPENTAAMIPALSAIFGVNIQSPLPGVANSRDIWGEKLGVTSKADPATAAMKRAGVQPNSADKKIRGVELSDEQHDQFQQMAGRMAKAQITRVINTPRFNSLPAGVQEEVLRKTYNGAREQAATRMMMAYPQIVQKAAQAKRDARLKGSPAAIKRREQQ